MLSRDRRKNRELSDAQFFYFFVVILAVEDVPLLRAFENGAFLALDFLAGGNVDSFFLIEQFFEQFAGFLADGVGVFNEFHFVHGLEDIRDRAGQHVHFVAAEPHSTALYLRTSSVFTFRNISW